jgi:hypothetical protein
MLFVSGLFHSAAAPFCEASSAGGAGQFSPARKGWVPNRKQGSSADRCDTLAQHILLIELNRMFFQQRQKLRIKSHLLVMGLLILDIGNDGG